MTREQLQKRLARLLECSPLMTDSISVHQAIAMLQRDGETIEMLADHLDCMIDYVCESSAWRMVGAQNALREARDALDAIAALKENSDGPA